MWKVEFKLQCAVFLKETTHFSLANGGDILRKPLFQKAIKSQQRFPTKRHN